MKLIKHIALGAFLVLGVFCVALYSTSCTKDSCKAVNCLNGGTCSGGHCTCLDSGVGGNNCETVYRLLYNNNTYAGNAVITYTPADSGYTNHTDNGNTLTFSYSATDTVTTHMQLVYKDSNATVLTVPIVLQNNSTAGSTFTIRATSGGPGNAYTYTGSGSVSGNNATVNLTATPPDTTTPVVYITMSSLPKQ